VQSRLNLINVKNDKPKNSLAEQKKISKAQPARGLPAEPTKSEKINPYLL
jgi:hypothetical protein